MAIESEQEAARPVGTLGVERWVQFSFFGAAITLGWFLINAVTAGWTILADTVDVVPEPNKTIIAASVILTCVISAILTYRNQRIHTFVNEVCVELSKVTWPTRQDTWSQTIVVLIVSAIAAVILGVFDFAWSNITDLIYNV